MMEELFRFFWRGALGGAIVPSLFYIYYAFLFRGSPLFWYLLVLSLFTLIPGAIVGFILWVLCQRFVERLGSLPRILLGTAIATTIAALELIYFSLSPPHNPLDTGELIVYLARILFWLIVNGFLTGGLAGWLCPATSMFRREPRLNYWERVREYEAAQAERDYWLAHLDSEKSRAPVAQFEASPGPVKKREVRL
jgi:hypothetical protein